jgi:hypothetical protein
MPSSQDLKADFQDFLKKASRILKQNREIRYAFLSDGKPIDNLA